MTSACSSPNWGRASGVFSTLMVSAERCLVSPRGSGNPVSGASHGGFVVATGFKVVLTGLVVVEAGPDVVVESATALEERASAPAPITAREATKRRIEETYRTSLARSFSGDSEVRR